MKRLGSKAIRDGAQETGLWTRLLRGLRYSRYDILASRENEFSD